MDNHNEDEVQNMDNQATDVGTTAYVKAVYDQCCRGEAVDAFISDLKQKNPVPFSGISIDIYFGHRFGAYPAVDLDPLEGVVLDQTSLKTVSVKWYGFWLDYMGSTGFLLTKKVLQDCSGVLEELELDIYRGHEYFMENAVQDSIFPRLKILKLRGQHAKDYAVYETFMRAMLSRAPNLQVLHSNLPVNLMLRVLGGSSVVPVYGPDVPAPFEEISEDVMSAIKLEDMQWEYTGFGFDMDRFNRITPMLLQQCCTTTLRSMWLDAVLAIPLMSYGIRLENVKNLWMNLDYGRLESVEPRILRIVKNFDFTRIFPNLNKVNIENLDNGCDFSPDHMDAIIDRENRVLREPMLDRAARVKDLVFCWNPSSAAAQFCVEMFPNVEKVEIKTRPYVDEQVPFGSIWNWFELKELKVRGDVLPTTGNLDSIFCGIFPEEVAELRRKDDKYLKRVNIVPVMPAVTCLKNLRNISLHHGHYGRDRFGHDATFMFSTVTALVAFARLPTLTVSLKISAESVPPAMTHLKPYVSVTSQLLDHKNWSTLD